MIDSRDERWLAEYQKEKARLDALPRRKWRKESEVYGSRTIAAIKKAHPHLRAKETYALGQSGYGPDHPVTMEISRRRAKKNPDLAYEAALHQGRRTRSMAQAAGSILGGVASVANNALRGLGGAIADNVGIQVAGRSAADAAGFVGAAAYDQVAPTVEAAPQAVAATGQALTATGGVAAQNIATHPVAPIVQHDVQAVGQAARPVLDAGLPQAVRDAPLPIQSFSRPGDNMRVGEVTAGLGDFGKGTIRTGLVAADVPLELVKGGFRGLSKTTYDNALAGSYFNPIGGLAENLREHSGNAGLGAVASRLEGDKVDLGTGLMPGGKIVEDEREASESALIRGQSISPGRVVAHTFFDPDEAAYSFMSGVLDFAFTLTADPAAAGGAAFARSKQASQFISAPERLRGGLTPTLNRLLVSSHRKQTMAEEVTQFFQNSDQGRKFVEWATDATPVEVWRNLGRRIDPELALQIGDTREIKAVEELLIEAGGGRLRNKPKVPRNDWRGETIRNARIGSDMPGKKIEFQGPGLRFNARTAEDYAKNAGITSQSTLDEIVDKMLRASTEDADVADRYDAVTFLMDKVSEAVLTKVSPKSASQKNALRDITRLWSEEMSTQRRYYVDQVGRNVAFPGVKIGPNNEVLGSPHLLIEGLNHSVTLPDARKIRRLTSTFRHLLAKGKGDDFGDLRLPFAALDHFMSEIWKPMQLFRIAWPIRVLGEQQFRLAAAGYEGPLTHPASYLAAVIADDGLIGKHLPELMKGRRHADVFGELFVNKADEFQPFASEIQRAANTSADFYNRVMRGKFQGRDLVQKGEGTRFLSGLADEHAQLAVDGVAQRVLRGRLFKGDVIPAAEGQKVEREGLAAIKEWFWHSDERQRVMRMQTLGKGEQPTTLASRSAADNYIDSIVERIETKTAGNPRLREALATRKLDGTDMFGKDGRINPEYRAALREFMGDFPDEAQVKAPAFFAKEEEAVWDKFTRRMFGALMGTPDSKLFRNPMFREAYWRRMEEIAPKLTKEAQTQLESAAKAAKLTKAEINNIGRATSHGVGEMTLKEAQLLAKGHALDEVHDLLYDLSRRGQWADGLRLLVPFGEAWKEVLTTWGKLIGQNPNVVRRAQTTIESARRSNIFFPDPLTGEESFAFPLTGGLMKVLMSVPWAGDGTLPFGFTGSVKGLNVAAQVIPGVGPVAALPMSFIVDHMPGGDFVSKALFPYGEPNVTLGNMGSWLEVIAPPWFRKTTAGTDESAMAQLYASSIQHVGEYLASTGKYDFTDPDDLLQWEKDSTSKAKWLTFVRGLAQMVLPTAPKPDWSVETEEHLKTVAFMRDELERLEKKHGHEAAPKELLKKYGDDLFLLLSPMSRGSAPSKTGVADWAKQHPDFRAKYRDVYGYFAPDTGDFDFDFYLDQMSKKERERFNLPERVVEAHRRIGFSWWSWAKDQVSGRTDSEAQRFRDEVKTKLIELYPGWGPEPGDMRKLPLQIRDVLRAADDPDVKNTPVAKAIREYRERRESVRQQMNPRSLKLSTAKKWQANREWLFDWGQKIAQDTPAFARVWEQVLSRELRIEEED